MSESMNLGVAAMRSLGSGGGKKGEIRASFLISICRQKRKIFELGLGVDNQS